MEWLFWAQKENNCLPTLPAKLSFIIEGKDKNLSWKIKKLKEFRTIRIHNHKTSTEEDA
jgi:hypothetical protein